MIAKPVRTKRKKKYRSPLKRIMDECDELVRQIIKKRDHACVTCGKTREQSRLDVGHLKPRGKKRVRWDLTNCNAQCPPCNNLHRFNQSLYELWYIKQYGMDAFVTLTELAIPVWQPRLPDMELIRARLQGALELLEK